MRTGFFREEEKAQILLLEKNHYLGKRKGESWILERINNENLQSSKAKNI